MCRSWYLIVGFHFYKKLARAFCISIHFYWCQTKQLTRFLIYSRNLCHSAIWRRCDRVQTSFQWFKAEPVLLGPSSSLPMTSFFVTRSQSSRRSSRDTCGNFKIKFTQFLFKFDQLTPSSDWPPPSVIGISNAKLSLKTGLSVRFLTCVFFFAIRWP